MIEANEYDESHLISIKTPIHLPYYANNPNFERIDGEVVINGIIYQYVQRRVFNDSLEIRVLPNNDRLHIKNAREDFYKLAQNIQDDGNQKKSIPINKSSAKLIIFDFLIQSDYWNVNELVPLKIAIGGNFNEGLLSICLPMLTPPPKQFA